VNQPLAEAYTGAWLLVPLHFQGQLWGSVTLSTEGRAHDWQDSEVELAGAIADQLAIAIQQSELYQRVQHLNADLEREVKKRTAQLQLAFEFEATLKRITDKVRDSLDENQILQTVVQELALVIGVSCCNAALYDLNEDTSMVCYEYTTTSAAISQGQVTRMADYPKIYHQLLQGQSFQFCFLQPHPVQGQVAILTSSIADDQEVLGDLWLINQRYYAFNEQDIRLVQQVANQCAIAIRQARLYQAAQVQVEEQRKLNRLKDDFLSTVSHELRTPISNMKMAIQMLELSLQPKTSSSTSVPSPTDSNKVNRYLQILHEECRREISLINDLLDLQRLEAQTQALALGAVELSIWLPQVMKPFQERTQNRQQQLQTDIPSSLPPLVTDPNNLERILAELLNNACKYTPPGETIIVTANLAEAQAPAGDAEAGGRAVQLSVKNSGVEIPASELPHIFDKFYRVPNADPWRQGGTGLGLALVKRLSERLGGRVWVESSLGQTCFTLELPLHRSGSDS
jgi:signal transduction histidine kinase